MIRGTIVEVALRPAGGELVGDHAAGSSTLTVYDAFGFSAAGGLLSVGAETYTYTSIDDETGTIVLSGVTTADYDDGDRVSILPVRTEKIATVVIDGTDGSVPARILHVLEPFLTEGVRAPADQEYALLLTDGDEYLVLDTPGKVPQIDPDAVGTVETVFIDGPPQYYSASSDGTDPLITPGDMVGLVDADWLTAMNGVTFDNGTVTFGNVTIDIIEPYYPIWVVPTGGKTIRARLDSFEVTEEGPDAAFYTLSPRIGFGGQQEDLQADTSNASYDEFAYYYNFETDPLYHGAFESQWTYYTDYFPGSATDDFQNPPLISATPQDSVISGGYPDTITNPAYACIGLNIPCATGGGPTATDYEFQITGLRVELS